MMEPCNRPKTAVLSRGATTSLTAVLRTSLWQTMISIHPNLTGCMPWKEGSRRDDSKRTYLKASGSTNDTDSLADLKDEFARTPSDRNT